MLAHGHARGETTSLHTWWCELTGVETIQSTLYYTNSVCVSVPSKPLEHLGHLMKVLPGGGGGGAGGGVRPCQSLFANVIRLTIQSCA